VHKRPYCPRGSSRDSRGLPEAPIFRVARVRALHLVRAVSHVPGCDLLAAHFSDLLRRLAEGCFRGSFCRLRDLATVRVGTFQAIDSHGPDDAPGSARSLSCLGGSAKQNPILKACGICSHRQGKRLLERYFKLSENHTSVRQEMLGGLTTFVTMAYIVV